MLYFVYVSPKPRMVLQNPKNLIHKLADNNKVGRGI